MAIYNFKKETQIFIVRGGLRYELDVYPDFSISQTFNETSVPVKTLHSQYNMFEDAVITRANPANFTFTVPLLLETDLKIVTSLLTDYDLTSTEATVKTADLYIKSTSEVYKLEKAVVETGIFQIQKDSIILLNVSGTAAKLSKFVGALPGTLQPRTTRTYSIPTSLSATLGGVTLENITSLSVELKNNVNWIDHATLHNSLGIIDASGTMYPEAFVVGSRTLSGNIQQYVTDVNGASVNTWKMGDALRIIVGNLSSTKVLDIDIPSVVYTNRLDTQELFMQSFDFRMDTNPSDLALIIKHVTI